ncbi:hypothetical protein A3A70_00910 [candidate division WWE3 bacterium RIFCSPLOWO2_01_FULL_42_11]|uniref:LysM domain-containing protein n=1 Tax=candidate division WWE3 bacterium RIFCSPLOWO2_01_FULL_42_11 TaxID=1802627 RepID=A0A1F4VQY6_UNCKA|nr:MAG: hypothetical protein A3A70_00910 [candidate division WWE3 bacterium RIFCSPLOWO2_01_FULL_42_11]
MEPHKPPKKSISSYWNPTLNHRSGILDPVIESTENIFISFSRFLHYISYLLVKRLIEAGFIFPKLVIIFIRTEDILRHKLFKWLISRRGASFRPAAHITILSLSFMLLFIGGEGGNILLSRGRVQRYVQADSDTQKRVIITRTDIPGSSIADQVIRYTVKDGDTLSSIGEKFRVSSESIKYTNNITDENSLQIGQVLSIPPIQGIIVKVSGGESVESLAAKYNVSPQVIVDFNYLQAPYSLEVGRDIAIPDATIPQPTLVNAQVSSGLGTAPSTQSEPKSGVVGTGQFQWPTDFRYISQYFSSYHPALDIAKYSPLYAADGGTVIEAVTSGWNYGYGKYVKIDHGNGYTTMYAHMQDLDVSAGDVVERGQTIGAMGATGRAFGVHVHFIVEYQGRFINPLSVL